MSFTSSVTDPDAGDTHSYSWTFGDGAGSSAENPSHSYGTAGTKTVTLEVTDSLGGESSGTISKTLRVNAPPNAVVSCSPTTVAPNQGTTCNGGSSSDAEGGLSYAWDIDGNGFNDGTDPSETFSFATPGGKTIRLRVTDGDGATDTAQQTVTVGNAAPTASFNWTPASPGVNDTITFNGSSSSDPEGQALTYAWALDGDGVFNDGSGQTVQRAYATGGNKTVQLRVTDPQGNSDSETKIVAVQNSAPTANFAFAGVNPVTPSVPDVNEQVNFASTSTDPDGNGTITTFEWDMNYDGSFNLERGGAAPSFTYSTAGTKRVALRVTDSTGAQSPIVEKNVRVNTPPVASISILNANLEDGQSSTVPLAGQPFAYTGRSLPALPGKAPVPGCPPVGASPAVNGSTDPDNSSDGNSTDIAAYAWDLDMDGAYDDATGPDAVAASGFPAGPRTVGLRVTDTDGTIGTTSRTFRINSPPVPQFLLEPLTPIVDQEISFSSTSSDPDAADHAGALTYSWDLDNDGTFCETGERGSIVKRAFPTPNTNPGHPVKLAVTDTGGITRTVTRGVVVQSTAPAGRFSWSPGAPLPGQAVTFDAGASTATAGKSVQAYQWDFNYNPSSGQFDVEAQGRSVSHSFPTAGAKNVALKVTETGGGFAVVTGRVVVNAPPRAGFNVSPTQPFARDVVTFSSSSQDPDGPLAKQEWDLDNDGRFDDAAGPVVLGKFAEPGRYTLSLRVTDSVGAAAVSSQQIRVRSRPLALLDVDVAINGLLHGMRTEVTSLLVLAPRGATVRVTCVTAGASAARAAGCSKALKRTVRKRRRLRFRGAERMLTAGTKLVIRVTKPGYLGLQVTYVMRGGNRPLRRDRCFRPGAKRTTRCPAP